MTQQEVEKNIENLYDLTRSSLAMAHALSAILSALPETAQIDRARAHEILDGIMRMQPGAQEVAIKAKVFLDVTLANAVKSKAKGEADEAGA